MTKDLFVKYLNSHCTEKEFEEFLTWIKEESQTPSGKKLIQEVWDEFEPAARPAETLKYNRLLDKIHIQIGKDANQNVVRRMPERYRIMSVITRAAAILLLPVLSFLIYTISSERVQYADNTNDLEV